MLQSELLRVQHRLLVSSDVLTNLSLLGVKMIDIREFYDKDGEEKPGKKGIALTIEQASF